MREALRTDVRGQQRRVHTALLAETRDELVVAERERRAVEAGWEPFEPSTEWFQGYVEDPRFLHGRVKLASGMAALPLAGLGGTLLALRREVFPPTNGGGVAGQHAPVLAALGWDLLPAALTALVLLLGLQACIHGVLGRIAQENDQRRRGGETELRMFNAPMPAQALLAYRRAHESGLFDALVVHSPRAQDFRAVAVVEAPSLGLLDPVLAGRIGRHSFLIARWDLANDLAEV